MYYYLGQLDEAVTSHRKAVELAPNDHLKHSNLGDALWIAGQQAAAKLSFEEAERLAIDALDVNPNDQNYQMDLAWISAMLGKDNDARALIERARPQSLDDPYLYYIDGLVQLRSGNTGAALAAFETAVEKGYSQTLLAAEPHLKELHQNLQFNRLLVRSESP